MTLAFVSYPAVEHPVGSGQDLYRRYEPARHLFHEVRDWTGIDVTGLLRDDPVEELNEAAPICQALLVLATVDALAEHGVVPAVVGGVSIGRLIAAAAGAVSRGPVPLPGTPRRAASASSLPRLPVLARDDHEHLLHVRHRYLGHGRWPSSTFSIDGRHRCNRPLRMARPGGGRASAAAARSP